MFFPGSIPPPTIPEGDLRVRFEPCATYQVPLGGPERALWAARKAPEKSA
jgi:hypothetical protein